MSKFKEQLKKYLGGISIKTDKVLSIGGQSDDKAYFESFECSEFVLFDNNREFAPQILFDINKSIQHEGGFEINDSHIEYYNMVLALNLWEYVYDPVTALKNIYDMMAPKAELIANFPFVYPVHRPAGNDYLRYTPEGVEKLLKQIGFTIIKHDYIFGSELLEDFYHIEGMKARDGFDHKIIGSIITARKG